MLDSYEYVVSAAPFVVRRRVRWSDCDPAGVAFTGRFSEYLVDAVDLFSNHVMDGSRAEFVRALGVDTPCKAMSLDFHVALRPQDSIDIEMTVDRIGEHSWDIVARARLPDGRLAFEGRFSPICIRPEPRGKAPIPAVLRARLEPHRSTPTSVSTSAPNRPSVPSAAIAAATAAARVYRVGQIVPSSNTTMETEIPALLHAREAVRPERFTFHSSRMRMHRVEPEELRRMNAQGERCAAELADARVDVMSTACLVAIMAQGPGYHREAEAALRASAEAAGCVAPVMTSAGALIEGLRTLGARRVAMLMPYMRPLADAVVAYVEAEGIEVVDMRCFCIPDNLAVGRHDPVRLVEEARTLDLARADALVLSACVQMPSLAALGIAQRALGLPVTSTAACTVHGMLTRLGLEPIAPGGGALLGDRDGLPAAPGTTA